jgi:hypothetical protein
MQLKASIERNSWLMGLLRRRRIGKIVKKLKLRQEI